MKTKAYLSKQEIYDGAVRHLFGQGGAAILPRGGAAYHGQGGRCCPIGNLIGVRDPNVDYLVNLAVSSTTRAEHVARLRALDRVLRHGYYVIPQYYGGNYRVGYRAHKFGQPAVAPTYYQPEDWVITTWWVKQ